VKGSEEEKTQDFQFLVTLKDSSGTPLTGTYTVESSSTGDALAPNYSSLTFDSSGQANVTLRHGQAITILGLPAGYTATAQELSVDTDKYTTEVNVDGTTTAATTATVATASSSAHRHEMEFINKSKNITLTIGKTVNGDANANDLMQSFLFTVQLSAKNYTVSDLTFAATDFGVEPLKAEDVTVTSTADGTTLQFRLKNGQTVCLGNLPSGTTYTVTEPLPDGSNGQNADLTYYTSTVNDTDAAGATTTTTLNASTRGLSGTLEESHELTFTNSRTSTLTIEKAITGTVNADASFSFTVTLLDQNGKALTGNYYGGVTVNNGTASIALQGGGRITLTGLPAGCTYTVQEINATDYTTTIAITGDDGTVDEATKTATGTVYGGTVVSFTNDKPLKPATGLRTDLLPTVLILALALGCALVLTIGKRRTWKRQ
jgi:hypothetical protein